MTGIITLKKTWKQCALTAEDIRERRKCKFHCIRRKGAKGLFLLQAWIYLGSREDLTLVSTACLQHFYHNTDNAGSPSSTLWLLSSCLQCVLGHSSTAVAGLSPAMAKAYPWVCCVNPGSWMAPHGGSAPDLPCLPPLDTSEGDFQHSGEVWSKKSSLYWESLDLNSSYTRRNSLPDSVRL